MTATTSPADPPRPPRVVPQIDPTGTDLHGEAAALRAHGPAAQVGLPGGVVAWAVTDPEVIKALDAIDGTVCMRVLAG